MSLSNKDLLGFNNWLWNILNMFICANQIKTIFFVFRSHPELSSVRPAPAVHHNATHAAPIVKTKVGIIV